MLLWRINRVTFATDCVVAWIYAKGRFLLAGRHSADLGGNDGLKGQGWIPLDKSLFRRELMELNRASPARLRNQYKSAQLYHDETECQRAIDYRQVTHSKRSQRDQERQEGKLMRNFHCGS